MDYSRYQRLKFERRGRILTIIMNRPETRNAIDKLMHRELSQVFLDVALDEEADVIVLTGIDNVFSSGGDINWISGDADPNTAEAKKVLNTLLDLEKPIIASIKGPAVGLAATIALYCDMAFASDDAKIADTHVKIGLSAGDGGAIIWPALIGFMRARQYLMTGDILSGKQAAEIGLINASVPMEQLDDLVYGFAERLANGPQKAIRYTKVSINIALREMLHKFQDASVAYEILCFATDDHKGAVKAFQEKRKPVFGKTRAST